MLHYEVHTTWQKCLLWQLITAFITSFFLFGVPFFLLNAEWDLPLLVISGSIFLVILAGILINRRYYILNISASENDTIIISYYHWFRRKDIRVNNRDLSFQMSPLKYNQRYFDLYYKNDRILRQFPYLDWKKQQMEQLRNQLIVFGIKERQ